jgi:hypothetical protein
LDRVRELIEKMREKREAAEPLIAEGQRLLSEAEEFSQQILVAQQACDDALAAHHQQKGLD